MDTRLFQLINQSMANPLFDVLMPALSHQGYLLFIPLALYALYSGSRTRTASGRTHLAFGLAAIVIAAFAVPIADVLGAWLKVLIARPRPCRTLEGIRLFVRCPSSFSMPSNHAATSFAAALPLFVLTRPFLPLIWRIAPLILAGLVAFSRPYLGVHYPSDILAGALLGAALAGMMCWVFLKSEKKMQRGAARTDRHRSMNIR